MAAGLVALLPRLVLALPYHPLPPLPPLPPVPPKLTNKVGELNVMTPEEIASELHKQLDIERKRIAELEEDKRTLLSEFADASSLDDARELILKEIKDSLLPNALVQLNSLLQHAESESVRASIAKWSAELVISGKVDAQGNSELGSILKGLQKNDKKEQPEHEQ